MEAQSTIDRIAEFSGMVWASGAFGIGAATEEAAANVLQKKFWRGRVWWPPFWARVKAHRIAVAEALVEADRWGHYAAREDLRYYYPKKWFCLLLYEDHVVAVAQRPPPPLRCVPHGVQGGQAPPGVRGEPQRGQRDPAQGGEVAVQDVHAAAGAAGQRRPEELHPGQVGRLPRPGPMSRCSSRGSPRSAST